MEYPVIQKYLLSVHMKSAWKVYVVGVNLVRILV